MNFTNYVQHDKTCMTSSQWSELFKENCQAVTYTKPALFFLLALVFEMMEIFIIRYVLKRIDIDKVFIDESWWIFRLKIDLAFILSQIKIFKVMFIAAGLILLYIQGGMIR